MSKQSQKIKRRKSSPYKFDGLLFKNMSPELICPGGRYNKQIRSDSHNNYQLGGKSQNKFIHFLAFFSQPASAMHARATHIFAIIPSISAAQ
jgi:hypothetical protein